MKLVLVTVQVQYAEAVEALVEAHGATDYVRWVAASGRDRQGKHTGSKVFPGNLTALTAQVPDERLEALLEALAAFRRESPAHGTLEAVVLPIERRL